MMNVSRVDRARPQSFTRRRDFGPDQFGRILGARLPFLFSAVTLHRIGWLDVLDATLAGASGALGRYTRTLHPGSP